MNDGKTFLSFFLSFLLSLSGPIPVLYSAFALKSRLPHHFITDLIAKHKQGPAQNNVNKKKKKKILNIFIIFILPFKTNGDLGMKILMCVCVSVSVPNYGMDRAGANRAREILV